MSIIESRWRERQSRSEDGLYFGTDDFVELCGTPGEGYRADVRASLALLLRSAPDVWTDLDDTCSAPAGDYQLFAGSTSGEGAGFVAVEQRSTRRLLWLLHLAEAEPFIEISAEGETIQAVSGGYPFRFEWHIPLHSPENLIVNPVRTA